MYVPRYLLFHPFLEVKSLPPEWELEGLNWTCRDSNHPPNSEVSHILVAPPLESPHGVGVSPATVTVSFPLRSKIKNY